MFIMAMGRIYEKLAVKLTDWGNLDNIDNIDGIVINDDFRDAQDSV